MRFGFPAIDQLASDLFSASREHSAFSTRWDQVCEPVKAEWRQKAMEVMLRLLPLLEPEDIKDRMIETDIPKGIDWTQLAEKQRDELTERITDYMKCLETPTCGPKQRQEAIENLCACAEAAKMSRELKEAASA